MLQGEPIFKRIKHFKKCFGGEKKDNELFSFLVCEKQDNPSKEGV